MRKIVKLNKNNNYKLNYRKKLRADSNSLFADHLPNTLTTEL